MERKFLGETIDVQPLPGSQGGEAWHVHGSRPFPLERWLGGFSILDWNGTAKASVEAFEAELHRAGVLVVWNARLGFWFRRCIANRVPFNPTQPLAPRAYHYDDDGENPFLGLFKGFEGPRAYGTAVSRPEAVQEAMRNQRRQLSPYLDPVIEDPLLVSKLQQWTLHLQAVSPEAVDYMGLAEFHRALISGVTESKKRYDLAREGRLDAAMAALMHMDRFYDAVDAELDQEHARHVQDYDRFGPAMPSALFIHNANGAHQWNRHAVPPRAAIPFIHGRAPLPNPPRLRSSNVSEDLDYHLFGGSRNHSPALDLY